MTLEPARARGSASDWDSLLFVWAAWSTTLFGALRVVYRGRKYPFADDWMLVRVWAGEQPVTLSWLWAQHGNHRIPLVKLVFLALYNRFTSYDLRIGVLFNVVALATLAAGMILTVRRLRGYTAYSDAFFPLALLQWGLTAVWWNFGVHFVCWTVVATSFLLIVVRHEGRMSVEYALLGATCLLFLPMCGTIGLALVPGLAAWLLLVGALEWQSENGSRQGALVAILGGAAAVGVALVYPVGLNFGSEYRSENFTLALRTGARFLSAGFSNAFVAIPNVPSQLIMPCLVLVSLGGLASAMRSRRSELRRAMGLVFFLAAMGCLAFAIGVGRGGLQRGGLRWDTGVFDYHYGLLAVPFLSWAYLVWCLYYHSRPVGRLVQMSLLVLMCVVFSLNLHAQSEPARLRDAEEQFEEDVRAGLPAPLLAERHLKLFWGEEHPDQGKAVVAKGLQWLRRTGTTPFRFIRED
jgi:hypothetical protein